VRAELSRNLSHHEGRFETVTLADSNLPAIVRTAWCARRTTPRRSGSPTTSPGRGGRRGRRRACSSAARATRRTSRQVYPFSPALIEALVALSDCLQRERTAIRILMELLVHHLPDLETGGWCPSATPSTRSPRARTPSTTR
jgi:hypothetical protein